MEQNLLGTGELGKSEALSIGARKYSLSCFTLY